jgi:hypothetical protein
MQFEGRVKEVMPEISGTSNRTGEPWKSQQFVFGFYESPDSIYERDILLQLRNDKIDQLKLQVGDRIKAKFGLGVRTYEGKKYNEIYTGDIEILQRAQPVQATAPAPEPSPQQHKTPTEPPQPCDDLPF